MSPVLPVDPGVGSDELWPPQATTPTINVGNNNQAQLRRRILIGRYPHDGFPGGAVLLA
jgi:hypothetical protein